MVQAPRQEKQGTNQTSRKTPSSKTSPKWIDRRRIQATEVAGKPEAPFSKETSTVSPSEAHRCDNALPPWLDELYTQGTSEIEATLPQTSEEAAPSEVEAASPTGAESAGEAAGSAAEQAQVPAWAQNLLLEEDLDEARAAEPELDATEANELPAWVRDLVTAR